MAQIARLLALVFWFGLVCFSVKKKKMHSILKFVRNNENRAVNEWRNGPGVVFLPVIHVSQQPVVLVLFTERTVRRS